ncbi:hypothetical protein ACXET9_02450 [Brachybacterium sp. DNPG3]
MNADLRSLLLRLAISTAGMLAVVGVCAAFGLRFSLPLPIALALIIGAISWLLNSTPRRADHVDAPRLDLDADFALPHAQDMRVRRTEDMIHGAQPSRRMTSRGLARTLAEIDDERRHDTAAPPLSGELDAILRAAREGDAAAHPVGPIDRRHLHRYLRELSRHSDQEG